MHVEWPFLYPEAPINLRWISSCLEMPFSLYFVSAPVCWSYISHSRVLAHHNRWRLTQVCHVLPYAKNFHSLSEPRKSNRRRNKNLKAASMLGFVHATLIFGFWKKIGSEGGSGLLRAVFAKVSFLVTTCASPVNFPIRASQLVLLCHSFLDTQKLHHFPATLVPAIPHLFMIVPVSPCYLLFSL